MAVRVYSACCRHDMVMCESVYNFTGYGGHQNGTEHRHQNQTPHHRHNPQIYKFKSPRVRSPSNIRHSTGLYAAYNQLAFLQFSARLAKIGVEKTC